MLKGLKTQEQNNTRLRHKTNRLVEATKSKTNTGTTTLERSAE